MIEWRDEGVILTVRPHGESAAIVDLFTREHGRHAGVVRGGGGRRLAPLLQAGNGVRAEWRARLGEHLGIFAIEPVASRAHVLGDRLALAGLASVCALLRFALPERQPHAALWDATLPVLDGLGGSDWPACYLRWELKLLDELGFGLDLSCCALTGARDDLGFVSPRTGRAVTRTAAGDWADRLFPLPDGLLADGPLGADALQQGFVITTHFLTRELAGEQSGKSLPEARGRLLDLLARSR